MRKNISSIFLLKSRQMVWIYTNNTLILGLALKREWKTKSQSINTRIRKDKIKIIHLYKEKQLRIRKDTIDISFF